MKKGAKKPAAKGNGHMMPGMPMMGGKMPPKKMPMKGKGMKHG